MRAKFAPMSPHGWRSGLTPALLCWVVTMRLASSLGAQPSEVPLPREQWGAPLVSVSPADGIWTIAGRKQTVRLNGSDLALEVRAGPATWRMVTSTTNDMDVRARGRDFPVRLADAPFKEIKPYDTGFKTGVKLTLRGWGDTDPRKRIAPIDLTLHLTIALEGKDEDLVFTIAAQEGEAVVRKLDWPTALDSRDFECTLLSNVRGVLLPRAWPKPYHPVRSANPDGSIKTNDVSEIQANVIECWSMSWWGFQQGKSAMMVIVETPDDAGYQFDHPAGGPTVIGPRWRTSLGRLGYVRAARMCFIPEGNYVDMAKRYRRYAKETGLFMSLEEKITRSPLVKDLIATPLTRAGILTNYKPDGERYRRANPSERYRLTTFDERANSLRQLKSNGVERLTVVLTGWPRLGYDRQHPDVLPPAPAAGSYEGMQRLADTCHELGYIFSLHDQYRDYYVDAPSWNPQFAIHEESAATPPRIFPGTRFGQAKEGDLPFMNHWDGGRMSYLNGRFMLGHLVKNYQGLFAHGIRPQGSYLDVFGYVPPDEDFNPEHPTTRTDCLRERAKCFNWARAHLGFVGTEAACDWTVPYADISSPLRHKNGVNVPLFNLVYHDAILTTYAPDDLNGLLNGGVPQMSSRADVSAETLVRVRRMAALNKRVALLELTRHEFLSANHRKERTTFADGTTVAVDWDAGTAEIKPDLNER